jgi:hypothetical protein
MMRSVAILRSSSDLRFGGMKSFASDNRKSSQVCSAVFAPLSARSVDWWTGMLVTASSPVIIVVVTEMTLQASSPTGDRSVGGMRTRFDSKELPAHLADLGTPEVTSSED